MRPSFKYMCKCCTYENFLLTGKCEGKGPKYLPNEDAFRLNTSQHRDSTQSIIEACSPSSSSTNLTACGPQESIINSTTTTTSLSTKTTPTKWTCSNCTYLNMSKAASRCVHCGACKTNTTESKQKTLKEPIKMIGTKSQARMRDELPFVAIRKPNTLTRCGYIPIDILQKSSENDLDFAQKVLENIKNYRRRYQELSVDFKYMPPKPADIRTDTISPRPQPTKKLKRKHGKHKENFPPPECDNLVAKSLNPQPTNKLKRKHKENVPPPECDNVVAKLVCEVKSRGVFDQFRTNCNADVDTKPAYQNLRQRVESTVSSFLNDQVWQPNLNKNQLRKKLRKHITTAAFFKTSVERIVDEVVNPKINSEIEDISYKYLGIEKPKPLNDKTAFNVDHRPTKIQNDQKHCRPSLTTHKQIGPLDTFNHPRRHNEWIKSF